MPKVAKNNLYIYLVILLIAFITLVLYQSQSMHQSVGIVQTTFSEPSFLVPSNISTQYLPEVVVDTYGPPLRNDQSPIQVDFYNGYPRNSTDERGAVVIESMHKCREVAQIQIETRGIPQEFTQVGILRVSKTGTNTIENRILSLFGRQFMKSGDKWQYYTLSNMGIMPTRLPIYVLQNGSEKDAMYEYGVDRLYSGDTIRVEGFDDEYIVKIYEARQYRYIG